MKRLLFISFGIFLSAICYSQEWVLVNGFPSNTCIYGLSYDSNTAYAVGYNPIDRAGSTVFTSSNKGTDWKQLCVVPGLVAGVISVNNGRILLSGFADNGYVTCYSDDNGNSWKQIETLSQKLVSSICKNGKSLLALCGTPGNYLLYESEDNGIMWQKKYSFPSECAVVTSIASHENHLVAVALFNSTYTLINSHDEGKTWAQASIDTPVSFISGVTYTSTGFYSTGQGTERTTSILFKSQDEGRSFSTVYTLPKEIQMIHSINLVDSRAFLVATGTNNQTLVFYKVL